ncbi:unnamed protein product [Orchesella dallaii]|uniref:HMG box domain-containing protein n=1 Tax=Orchesella dallaii TaxID=48710 RepID=A0ABP1QWT3_9HEXA
MAKPKGNPKSSKQTGGCRKSPRLQKQAPGKGLGTSKRPNKITKVKPIKSEKVKPAANGRCQVWKKKPKRRLTTYNLFVRHVNNHSKANGCCLTGQGLIEQASLCWKLLTEEQKRNFRNANLPTKLKGPNAFSPPFANDANDEENWVGRGSYS